VTNVSASGSVEQKALYGAVREVFELSSFRLLTALA